MVVMVKVFILQLACREAENHFTIGRHPKMEGKMNEKDILQKWNVHRCEE